jgi:hypothetical protein
MALPAAEVLRGRRRSYARRGLPQTRRSTNPSLFALLRAAINAMATTRGARGELARLYRAGTRHVTDRIHAGAPCLRSVPNGGDAGAFGQAAARGHVRDTMLLRPIAYELQSPEWRLNRNLGGSTRAAPAGCGLPGRWPGLEWWSYPDRSAAYAAQRTGARCTRARSGFPVWIGPVVTLDSPFSLA